jgi:hypothetical protein
MAIEQLIELMARIQPRHDGGAQPDDRDESQHQRQQACLQGFKAVQALHAGSWERSTV